MMHWHGPHLWSESTAAYLNKTWNKPRGWLHDAVRKAAEHQLMVDVHDEYRPEDWCQMVAFREAMRALEGGTTIAMTADVPSGLPRRAGIGIVKHRDEARQAIPSIQVNALFPHQLADICQEEDLWLHVDGAFGAWAAIARGWAASSASRPNTNPKAPSAAAHGTQRPGAITAGAIANGMPASRTRSARGVGWIIGEPAPAR